MLTLSDMSTCRWLLFQYDSTIKFSPGSQDGDVGSVSTFWGNAETRSTYDMFIYLELMQKISTEETK